MKKLIFLFFSSFFHGWMLRTCPQCNVLGFGGALVPLRGGSSENVLSKGKENDSRHLRQRSGGVFVSEGNNNFSGSDTGTRNRTIPATQVEIIK